MGWNRVIVLGVMALASLVVRAEEVEVEPKPPTGPIELETEIGSAAGVHDKVDAKLSLWMDGETVRREVVVVGGGFMSSIIRMTPEEALTAAAFLEQKAETPEPGKLKEGEITVDAAEDEGRKSVTLQKTGSGAGRGLVRLPPDHAALLAGHLRRAVAVSAWLAERMEDVNW